MRAIENGFSVCFTRVDELVYQLKADANISPARLKHKKYMASNLFILDEFGYQPLDREAANLLFRVVSYRYQRGSIAMTTNKGITSWPEVLAGDEVLAGAILDRLLHSATVLNIQGRSYRLRDMEASVGQVAPASTPSASEESSPTSK
jgi:DNA replication protein DnaC